MNQVYMLFKTSLMKYNKDSVTHTLQMSDSRGELSVLTLKVYDGPFILCFIFFNGYVRSAEVLVELSK